MFILSSIAWLLVGFVVGMLGMIAWTDRRRAAREKRRSALFDPYQAEARAYLPRSARG
ncbi:MAG: hypothetical protein KJS97_00660 [Alphaproteobacteria bacterium]|nr:hypothetical protein [Alphaproteobacteria bacterium]